MIEKPKAVYRMPNKSVRLLDPIHFKEERGRNSRKNVGTSMLSDLRQYIENFPDKVEVR